MELVTDDSAEPRIASREAIRKELDRLESSEPESGTFLIIAKAEQVYIQAAPLNGGFALEIREGNEASHMVAAPLNSSSEKALRQPGGFFAKLFKEPLAQSTPVARSSCEAALVAFCEGRQFKSSFDWHKLFI